MSIISENFKPITSIPSLSGISFSINLSTFGYLSLSPLLDGTIITSSVGNESTGEGSIASISRGIFYVKGNFVTASEDTVILSKYNKNPSLRIGLNTTETIIDSNDDTTLLDPALSATNYQAPGSGPASPAVGEL